MLFRAQAIALSGLLLFSAAVSAATTSTTAPASQAIDGIAAVVNNSVITQSQLQQQEQMFLAQSQQSNQTPPSAAQLKETVLNNMIDTQLILQAAKANKLTVQPTQLNGALTGIAQQNNMTVAQLQTAVTNQGIDWQSYTSQISDQILASMATERAMGSKIVISDAEIADFINRYQSQMTQVVQYHLQGLRVPLAANASAADVAKAQTLANGLAASMKKGIQVDVAALNASTGQTVQGGDMGWRAINQIPTPVATNIATMQPNEVTGPFQGTDGFYVFKFLGQRAQTIPHMAQTYQLNRIFVKTNTMNSAETVQAQLQALTDQINSGKKTFAEAAAQYSQDVNTAEKGGSIGWQPASLLQPNEVAALQTLKPGQISVPVQTQGGYEILQMLASKQIDDTHNFMVMQAKQVLFQQKMQKATQEWVAQLRKQAFIKLM